MLDAAMTFRDGIGVDDLTWLAGLIAVVTTIVGAVQGYACEALIVGKNTGAAEAGVYKVQFALVRHGGNLLQIGTTTVTVIGEDDATWDVGVSVDAAIRVFTLLVTGAAGKTIHWVASLRCVGAI